MVYNAFVKNKTAYITDYLRKLTNAIHGWTALDELAFLYRTAQLQKKGGVIVEIGSWQGRSTVCMAKGSEHGNGARIYAIDPFTGSSENQIPGVKIWTRDDFERNLEKTDTKALVTTLAMTSDDAAKSWDRPIDFLFIDGAHEYEYVKNDFLLFSPYVVDGGIIAFHDTTPNLKAILQGLPLFGLPGPRQVVWEYVFKQRTFKNIGLSGSILYATKCNANSFADRLKNNLCGLEMLAKYMVYALYVRLKKIPGPIKSLLKPIKSSFSR